MSSGDNADTETLGDSGHESSESVKEISEGTENPSEPSVTVSDQSASEKNAEPSTEAKALPEPAVETNAPQGEAVTSTPPTTEETTESGKPPELRPASKPYPWIVSPVFDFFFVTGGLVWILLIANYSLLGTEVPFDKTNYKHLILLTAVYISQHVFFDAHNIATFFRLWGSPEDRETFKFYRTWLFYGAIAFFVLAVVMRQIIGTLVFWYLVVTFWHYAMQTFGVALIYCEKRSYKFTGFEREVFRTLMLLLSAYAIARFLVRQELAPYNLYGAAAPFWIPINTPTSQLVLQIITVALAGVSVVFFLIVVRKLIVDRRILPFPVAMLLATIGALGCAPKEINALLWLYVPAMYHASQYLAVSLSYYVKERGLPEGMNPSLIAKEIQKWPALNYLGKAILIGCTLYIVLPHLIQLVGLGGYDEMIGLTFVVVNYHHFATDAAIWRLRDQRVRKILIA